MAITAEILLGYLEKAGIKLVVSDGSLVVSKSSSRQPSAKEQSQIDSFSQEIIEILNLRSASTVSGSPSSVEYGLTGPTSRFKRGRDINNVETFNGLTGDVVGVGSFNGLTGAVQGVASYNGNTGDVQGVSSFAAFTGDVAVGVTTNQILYHSGSSITGSNDFTFDGTDVVLGGQGHFEGCFDGPIQKDIKADEALAAGDPVYITGNVGASNRVTVAKSDASDPVKMPAAGIVGTAFNTNDEGLMTLVGTLKQFDTSGYTANDELYVSPGGGLTSARPTSASHQVQKIVRVGRVSATTGTIMVHGAGRANDVPNLLHARAGISTDAGITFPDGTHQTTAGGVSTINGLTGGATLNAGTNITLTTGASGITIDASGGSGLDTSQPLTLTGGDTSTASFTIESDDNGTSAAPIIDLIRDPADDGNGANGDYLGQIKFKGQSDSGTERVYAKITGKIGTATNSDEDGVVEHMVRRDGSAQIVFRTTKTGIKLNADGGTPMELEFSDGTSINTAPSGGAGSTLSVGFILDGNGSPLGTGDKLDALKQIPYDCYVLNTEAYLQGGLSGSTKAIEVAVKKVKGLTAAVSTIGSAGVTLQIGSSGGSDVDILTFLGGAGLTYYYALGDNSDSAGSTLSKGEWIYPFVHGNSGDVDKIQLFLNLSPL